MENSGFPGNRPVIETPRRRNLWVIVIIIIALLVFLLVLVKNNQKKNEKELRKAEITNHLRDYIIVNTNDYKVNPLGGLSDIRIKVSNKSEYSFEDVELQVNYVKVSGEVFQNETLHTGYLAPYGEVVKEAPSTDRGIKVNYHLNHIRSKDLDLDQSVN